jgi:hypothetical protein
VLEPDAAPEESRAPERGGTPLRRRIVWIAVGTAVAVAGIALFVVRGSHPPPPATTTQTPAPKKEPGRADESPLAISEAALAKNPIATAKAVRTKLAPDLQIVGSVSYDQDHYAVVGPLIPGRVTK